MKIIFINSPIAPLNPATELVEVCFVNTWLKFVYNTYWLNFVYKYLITVYLEMTDVCSQYWHKFVQNYLKFVQLNEDCSQLTEVSWKIDRPRDDKILTNEDFMFVHQWLEYVQSCLKLSNLLRLPWQKAKIICLHLHTLPVVPNFVDAPRVTSGVNDVWNDINVM